MFGAILDLSGLTQAGGSPAHRRQEEDDHHYEDAQHDHEEEVDDSEVMIQSWFLPDRAHCRPQATLFWSGRQSPQKPAQAPP